MLDGWASQEPHAWWLSQPGAPKNLSYNCNVVSMRPLCVNETLWQIFWEWSESSLDLRLQRTGKYTWVVKWSINWIWQKQEFGAKTDFENNAIKEGIALTKDAGWRFEPTFISLWSGLGQINITGCFVSSSKIPLLGICNYNSWDVNDASYQIGWF